MSDVADCLEAAGDVSIIDRLWQQYPQCFIHCKILIRQIDLLIWLNSKFLLILFDVFVKLLPIFTREILKDDGFMIVVTFDR